MSVDALDSTPFDLRMPFKSIMYFAEAVISRNYIIIYKKSDKIDIRSLTWLIGL